MELIKKTRMNQFEKKVNHFSVSKPKNQWAKKPWTLFILSHIGIVFAWLVWWMGVALWIQSFLLSCLIGAVLFWLFYQFLKPYFKGGSITGYDPWHLKLDLEQHIPSVSATVVSNQTPFCFLVHFLHIKKMALSLPLLEVLKKQESKHLIQCFHVYFHNGYGSFFTQVSYVIFVLYWPFHILIALFQKLKFRWGSVGFNYLLRYVLYLPFYPLLHWKYFQLDKHCAKAIGDQKAYCLLLWTLQAYWSVSSKTPFLFLSSLFITNPLTQVNSYFNIQPSVEKRIQKLTGRFPV